MIYSKLPKVQENRNGMNSQPDALIALVDTENG